MDVQVELVLNVLAQVGRMELAVEAVRLVVKAVQLDRDNRQELVLP
jgi:hypothetical protein